MSHSKSNSDNTIGRILTKSYEQPMNMAYITMCQYILYGIVFGIWFYRVFFKDTTKANDFQKLKEIKLWLCIIPAGYAAQLMVDGILTLVRPMFPEAFAQYDKMVSNVTGVNSSWAMLISVLFIAPIAEELLFRGLILGYSKKAFPPAIAILLQGAIFGLYHGNIIQGTYAFVIGSVLGLVAYRLNKLIPCIILHISINASLLFVPKELYATQTKTMATTIVSGVIFAIMIWLVTRKKKVNDN